MTDVVLNKLQTIRRCIDRIQDEYANDPNNLNNITKQDAIILNIQRACEAAISKCICALKEIMVFLRIVERHLRF